MTTTLKRTEDLPALLLLSFKGVDHRFGMMQMMALPDDWNGMVSPKERVQDIFDDLAPLIFRARFDPVESFQSLMRKIWTDLTEDDVGQFNRLYASLMREAIAGLSDRQWRVRQAA